MIDRRDDLTQRHGLARGMKARIRQRTPDVTASGERRRPDTTSGHSAGLRALVAVLTFATIYTLVSRWFGVSISAMVAVLAAIPGILLAARGRRT